MTARDLLAQLGTLPDWEFEDNTSDAALVCVHTGPFHGTWDLAIGGDGQIFGGEALWGMLQEMRERKTFLAKTTPWGIAESAEVQALRDALFDRGYALGANAVIKGYIQWQQVKVKEGEGC